MAPGPQHCLAASLRVTSALAWCPLCPRVWSCGFSMPPHRKESLCAAGAQQNETPTRFNRRGPLPSTALCLLSVDSEGSGGEHLVPGSFREQARGVRAAEDSLEI